MLVSSLEILNESLNVIRHLMSIFKTNRDYDNTNEFQKYLLKNNDFWNNIIFGLIKLGSPKLVVSSNITFVKRTSFFSFSWLLRTMNIAEQQASNILYIFKLYSIKSLNFVQL